MIFLDNYFKMQVVTYNFHLHIDKIYNREGGVTDALDSTNTKPVVKAWAQRVPQLLICFYQAMAAPRPIGLEAMVKKCSTYTQTAPNALLDVYVFILFGLGTINCNIGREMLQLYWTHFQWMDAAGLHVQHYYQGHSMLQHQKYKSSSVCHSQPSRLKCKILFFKKMREKSKSEVRECFCGEWESK